MNDSCECRVNRAQLPNNKVFPLETPKVFLHVALVHFSINRIPTRMKNAKKPSKINEKRGDAAANWRCSYVTPFGRESTGRVNPLPPRRRAIRDFDGLWWSG
jgi:hypothetical protein